MKFLLTGQPRSGKTTLLSKLLEAETNKQGFVTKELIEDGERVGFELVSADGNKATLAHVNIESSNKVSRYFVDVSALDSFIEPLFTFSPGQLLYIDEVGQMELFSEKFKELVSKYLDSKNDFIGTITSVYSDDFVEQIKARPDIKIIELTPENRQQLLAELKF